MAQLDGRGTSLTIAGQHVQETSGTVALNAQQLRLNLRVLQAGQRNGTLSGALGLRLDEHAVDISEAVIGSAARPGGWTPPAVRSRFDGTLMASPSPRRRSWAETATNESASPEPGASDGTGALRVTRVSRLHRYVPVGVRSAHALRRCRSTPTLTIRGTRARPLATGTVSVTNGRVERVSYQKLAGASTTLTTRSRSTCASTSHRASGSRPWARCRWRSSTTSLAERPIDVAIKSSGINLGLLEGLTNRVTNVNGGIRIDARAIGTSRDPHFTGTVAIERAEFQVAGTGASTRTAVPHSR